MKSAFVFVSSNQVGERSGEFLVVLALKDAFTWMDGEAVWEEGISVGMLQGPVRIEVQGAVHTALNHN